MQIFSTTIFLGTIFALASASSAAEIRTRDFQFENSGIIYQTEPTFVVGNFPKEKKVATPKLVLKLTQNIQPIVNSNTPIEQAPQQDSQKEKCYQAISQCHIRPIYFRFKETVLTQAEQQKFVLEINHDKEKQTPLVVVGYTCKIGTLSQNQIIADQRATYVANILRQNGFNVVESVGKPKTNFVTEDPKKQHLNRRVVVAKMETKIEVKNWKSSLPKSL